MSPQQYCLKWKYHNANIQNTFSLLREKASYCDVTLWSGGAAMRAHRAVLASCSSLFADLLSAHDPTLGEPAIVLTDAVHAHHLRHLLAFMYTGEVSVHHAELATLLKTAEDLRIKGLADVSFSDPQIGRECPNAATTAEIVAATPDPAKARSAAGKSDDESETKNSDSVPVVVSTSSLNGSSMIVINAEPSKRRRGRPPLEPRITPIDNEVIVPDPPKRPKMMTATPNILRRSKLIEHNKNDGVIDITPNWNVTSTPNQENEAEEILSEYSEASLDGRDISQFLDTTMEEEPPDVSLKIPGKPMVVMPSENPLAIEHVEATSVQVKDNPLFADVVKLSDYLLSGRRTQFWAEDYVKRVMEAVFCRELEMKQAAEILGVSYGTLYGRYRDTFGCINRPYRAREFWSENSDVLAKLQRKEITFMKAAELLSITPQMLFNYVNTVAEPVINQKEASDIFTDAIVRASAKSEIKTNSDFEKKMSDMKGEESYNRLSDILRKHHDLIEASKTTESASKQDIKSELIEEDLSVDVDCSVKEASPVKEPEEKNDSKTSPASEPSSSTANQNPPKKLPMIRVANLKFLKGELPSGPLNITELGEKVNSPLVIKTTPFVRPDLKMMSSKRKVTFQEIELSLKQTHLNATKKNTTTSVKPPAPVT